MKVIGAVAGDMGEVVKAAMMLRVAVPKTAVKEGAGLVMVTVMVSVGVAVVVVVTVRCSSRNAV